MGSAWPAGFDRIPNESWAQAPLETLALKYDTVEGHGWYRNLEPTLDHLHAALAPGEILVDYSGGTGILVDRYLKRYPDAKAHFLIVDSSPKFLRLAKEKLGDDERVGFRLIRYLREEKRLQLMEEVFGSALLERGVDALVSTNAVHLYYGLPATLASWRKVLRRGAQVFVQSGNIRNPAAGAHEWIIDETVEAIHETAVRMVREDDAWAQWRDAAADGERMAKYDKLRAKYFLPVRPLDHYQAALIGAELPVEHVENRAIDAEVSEWYDFLAVYHEGVLGWLGGVERIDGAAASDEAVQERLKLIRAAMHHLFGGRDTFQACWTYIRARNG